MATLVEFGGTAFAFLRARRPATARFRPPPGASCAAHPAIRRRRGSASSSRGRAASETPNRRPQKRFCRPPHPRSRLTSRCGAFSSLPLCGEALPRLSAEGNRRGAGRAIRARRPERPREGADSRTREFRGPSVILTPGAVGRVLCTRVKIMLAGCPRNSGRASCRAALAVRRAAGANQSAGTYGGVYVESWRC